MQKTNLFVWVALVAVAILALGGYIFPRVSGAFGGITNYDTIEASSLAIGSGCNSSFGTCNGTTISRINTGQCYLAPSQATIAASTTISIDCQATAAVSANGPAALAGITSGDNVSVTLSTTTAQVGNGTGNGIMIAGASASTTSGFITLRLANLTGGTFTFPTTLTSSGTASYIATH